tara:strand:+ start:39365 stop:40738 length:1374 start_codon:yes stop_codon:yes gene_type:complete
LRGGKQKSDGHDLKKGMNMDLKYVYGSHEIEFKEDDDDAFFLKWWRFQYAHRHFYRLKTQNKTLQKELDGCIPTLFEIFDRLQMGQHDELDLLYFYDLEFYQFVNVLVYQYHRAEHGADSYLDLRYEIDTALYRYPLKNLNRTEIEVVKQIHYWTLKLGFLSVQFFDKPDLIASRDAFIFNTLDKDSLKQNSIFFPYYTGTNAAPGLNIMTEDNLQEVTWDWDMAVFYHDGDVIDQIKKKMPNAKEWKKSGTKVIGEQEGSSIQMYIKRELCSKTKALRWLTGQVERRKFFKESRLQINPIHSTPCSETQKRKNDKFIDMTREADGLSAYRRETKKDNLRRAVAILNWDMQNIHEKGGLNKNSRCKETVEFLDQRDPKLIEYYNSKFNNKWEDDRETPANENAPQFDIEMRNGDIDSYHSNVVREMEKDYDVAEFCIQKIENYTYQDVRRARKKSKE